MTGAFLFGAAEEVERIDPRVVLEIEGMEGFVVAVCYLLQ
jgi:hypothetical protein